MKRLTRWIEARLWLKCLWSHLNKSVVSMMRWWDDETMRRWDDEMKRWEEKITQCNSKLVKQKETKWKGKLKKSSNRVWIKMKIHVLFTVHQIMDWWSQDILHCFASFSASHSFFFFNQNDTHKFSFLFILSLSLALLSAIYTLYFATIFFAFPRSLSFSLSLFISWTAITKLQKWFAIWTN